MKLAFNIGQHRVALGFAPPAVPADATPQEWAREERASRRRLAADAVFLVLTALMWFHMAPENRTPWFGALTVLLWAGFLWTDLRRHLRARGHARLSPPEDRP